MVVLVVSGWIIIADLISGEQTGLNFDKTLLHFVSLDSSSLGSAFGWIILGDLICGNQTGSNFGKTVPSLDSTRGLRLSGDQTGSRRQKIILPFTLWDKWNICGRKLRHVFRTQSVLYFSSVIVNQNMSNGSFKNWKWFPEDLTTHNNNQVSASLLKTWHARVIRNPLITVKIRLAGLSWVYGTHGCCEVLEFYSVVL